MKLWRNERIRTDQQMRQEEMSEVVNLHHGMQTVCRSVFFRRSNPSVVDQDVQLVFALQDFRRKISDRFERRQVQVLGKDVGVVCEFDYVEFWLLHVCYVRHDDFATSRGQIQGSLITDSWYQNVIISSKTWKSSPELAPVTIAVLPTRHELLLVIAMAKRK
jgi:hypothetical protein